MIYCEVVRILFTAVASHVNVSSVDHLTRLTAYCCLTANYLKTWNAGCIVYLCYGVDRTGEETKLGKKNSVS
jgi:hypothetical protein